MRSSVEGVLKALADPTRRGIFERLTHVGEQTVHALTEAGTVSQPMVSKHLAALKRVQLVRCRRRGRETHYSAHPEALSPLLDWMTHYTKFWKTSFDRLEKVLEGMDR
ncbi:MAG: metalloregulator ArsR/SmtB family transcription factor [Acidobacteriota bacterium]|nr:metalloregulator ArsR/SmtB family transcription factor [Acidobacteriota bacterium]